MVEIAPEQPQTKHVRIGDYVITGKVGTGGIAEIYRGRQESLDRDVAIKILSSKLSSDTDLLRRFEREAMVIARLNHPNIVHVIDRGKAGNRYYFVMEYVDGTSLREVIDSKKILLRTKIEMMAQVCKALDYAHKNGIIHRDIKPANILIDRQGNPRVADFGIAQIVGSPDAEVTSSDVIMGTFSYMSPEQKVSSTAVDQTTDIYAMGIILYEILTGMRPEGRFKLPSEVSPSIDPGYDDVVQKCLAQEAKDRYQSAVELKNDLLNVLSGVHQKLPHSDYSTQDTDSIIGKCRYLDTIKETRFSSTILVENRLNKRLYVIKKHSKGEAGKKEAKLLTTLKHKHILNILGSGGDNRNTVIVLEYAQGGSLAERMVRKYHWEKALAISLDVASGLDFAHKNNIMHGNLRPSNILFTAGEEVKISDFGMAPHYDSRRKKNWYAPPEHKVSRQGDIYALGVIIHQLITGRNPEYDAADRLKLTDIERDLPEEVAAMLRKALAIRVARRYKSVEQLLADWEEFQERLQRSRQEALVSLPAPAIAGSSVPRWLIIGGVAGFLCAIGLLLYILKFLN
jgi:serine/threonine protein kinase